MNALSQTNLIQEVVLCSCSSAAFHSAVDPWHVSSWYHWWMDSKKHWLKHSKTKISWNQQERQNKSSVPCLFTHWKRQETTALFLLKVYVLCRLIHDIGVIHCASGWWRCGVFLWCETAIFYNLICLDCPYPYQYLYKDLENKGFFFSSRASFMSPFKVLQKNRIN